MDIEYFFYYCMNKFRASQVKTTLHNTGLPTKDENSIATALLFNVKNTIPVFILSWFCWVDRNPDHFPLYSFAQSKCKKSVYVVQSKKIERLSYLNVIN